MFFFFFYLPPLGGPTLYVDHPRFGAGHRGLAFTHAHGRVLRRYITNDGPHNTHRRRAPLIRGEVSDPSRPLLSLPLPIPYLVDLGFPRPGAGRLCVFVFFS
eukprot:NODE_2320_length_801_cov_229.626330_g1613_i0.p2 GENE.NODE_2320_length_801_cov_229.626330_g1613_i0~~NODE_2320_length_801_cov_229.626330_g1613_i0.p2  ORF type:complete len:102 (-),score=23.33 NODE_2320_length_801_cov_229.626330_g1613_i0:78-383(-)